MSGSGEPEGGNVDVGTTEGVGRGMGGKRGPADTRTLSRGITMTLLMAPFSTVVARAMEVGQEVAMDEGSGTRA